MKWVAFDGWGVVFRECDDVANKLTPFIRRRNPSVTGADILAAYRLASVGEINEEEFWRRVGLGAGFPRVREELLDTYEVLDEGFVGVAARFQGRYSLGLLSNDLTAWSEGLRRRYGIERFFEVAVVSDRAGSRKPNRGIYETFLARAGCAPGECLFIDDRLHNLRAAAEIGMRTCWFDRGQAADGEFRADRRIGSFGDLAGVAAELLG